jgi:hypothetical protein
MSLAYDLFSFLVINNQDISTETRQAISLVSSIISTFAAQNIPLTDTLIDDAYAWVTTQKLPLAPLSEEAAASLVEELTGLGI